MTAGPPTHTALLELVRAVDDACHQRTSALWREPFDADVHEAAVAVHEAAHQAVTEAVTAVYFELARARSQRRPVTVTDGRDGRDGAGDGLTDGVTGDVTGEGRPVSRVRHLTEVPVRDRVTQHECSRCAAVITLDHRAPVLVCRARYAPMDPGPLWPALGDWPQLLAIATPTPGLPLAARKAPTGPVLCQGCEAALQEWLHGRPAPPRSPRPRRHQPLALAPDDDDPGRDPGGALHARL